MGFLSAIKSAATLIVSNARSTFGGGGASVGRATPGNSCSVNGGRSTATSVNPFSAGLPSGIGTNVAGSTPAMLKQSDQKAPCLLCEIARGGAVEAGLHILEKGTPHAKIASKVLGPVAVAVSFVDAGVEAKRTLELSRQGDVKSTAHSASKVTGFTVAGTLGFLLGGGAYAVTFLLIAAGIISAPAWAPVAAAIVVGSLVTLVANELWNKWGQEKTANAYTSYMNQTTGKPIPSAAPVSIAAGLVVGLGTAALLTATAPGWIPIAIGVTAGSAALVGTKAIWNKFVE